MPNKFEERISISSQTILKGNSSLDGLRRLMTWDFDRVNEVAQNLEVGLALEPLAQVTALGRDVARLADRDQTPKVPGAVEQVTVITQPPRSEKNVLDVVPTFKNIKDGTFWRKLQRAPVALAYTLTQQYRESSMQTLQDVQTLVWRKTFRNRPVRVHEPLGSNDKRPDTPMVANMQLTSSTEYFNDRILAQEGENLTDTQKVQILARFIEENGYHGFSANLLHIISGKMSDTPVEFLKALLDGKIVTQNVEVPLVNMIEVQPGRNDLEANVPFIQMVPYIWDAVAARDDVHFMYAGTLENAEHDIHEIKKIIRN